MSLLMTKDDLDKDIRANKCDCGRPGCTNQATSAGFGCNACKSSNEARDWPVCARYDSDTGLLYLTCSKCGRRCVELPIASTKAYQAERN